MSPPPGILQLKKKYQGYSGIFVLIKNWGDFQGTIPGITRITS
jgi:hypothetical protein